MFINMQEKMRKLVLSTEESFLGHPIEEDDEFDWMYDDFMDELPNDPCVITGTLGLWHGQKDIMPYDCDTYTEAIRKCLGNDTEDFSIWEVDDEGVAHPTYQIEAHHHDGCNRFTISPKTEEDDDE